MDSVLSQSFSEFEAIVVMDGARLRGDEPWISDSRVRVIQIAEQSGLSNALNTGIRAARAEYIARLDSDDRALPERLAIQVPYLDSRPECVLVGSSYWVIDEEGQRTGGRSNVYSGDVRHALLLRNRVAHPSVLMRRRAVVEAGFYDTSVSNMEDYHLWLRLATLGAVEAIPDRLLEYRVHGNQMSRSANPRADYVGKVIDERRALAARFEGTLLRQRWRDLLWLGAAWARAYGVRQKMRVK